MQKKQNKKSKIQLPAITRSKSSRNVKPAPAKTTQAAGVHREIISIHQFSKIAMIFWIGGCLMAITVTFPMLFSTLDMITASNLVRQLLYITAYIGVVCLTVALIEVIINHKLALIATKRFWYIIAMATILIVNNFAIFPAIHKFREQASHLAHQIIALQDNVFDFWHSFSAILFICICVLGILYLIEM